MPAAPSPTLSLAANEPRAPALETVLPSSHKCMIHAPNTRPVPSLGARCASYNFWFPPLRRKLPSVLSF